MTAALLLSLAVGWGQEVPARHGPGGIRIEAESAALRLGLVASADSSSLAIRSATGVLTLFDGSPDVVWQARNESVPTEASLSAPVSRDSEGWWLPVDAFAFFGLWVHDGVVEGPDGIFARLEFPVHSPPTGLSAELVELGQGVPAVRLYAPGPAGEASQSLLLADAGLLGLVMPDERDRFDRLVAQAGSDHALVLVLTALSEATWEGVIRFSQGAVEAEVRHPFRLRLLEGDANTVGPDAPVLAVILLPEEFNLREPVRVDWGEANATITFRR